jgi:hypothetical protein
MRQCVVFSAVVTALVVLGCEKNARADIHWDDARYWMIPSWRLSSALHRSTLPDELTLCQPAGKTCPALRTLGPGEYQRGPVWTTAIELGAEMIALGPFRFGIEGSFGWGTGPPGRVPELAPHTGVVPTSGIGTAQTLSSQWQRSAGGLVFGLRVRGESWRAFVDAVPGFTNLETSLDGAGPNGNPLVAIGTAYTLGTRAGIGIIANRFLSASAFGGVGWGEITDVTAGVRLELMTDALHPPPNAP